jgi:hypothetical protein
VRPLLPRPLLAFRAFLPLILLAGSLLLCCPAAVLSREPAQDTPPPGAQAPNRFADDPRLDQKISLTAWSEPLEDVLSRLSRETGVQLIFEGRDVGDQRVDIVLREQPLRRVQLLLAETLDLYWRRDRKAPGYRYVLFQDVRSRKLEQELLARGSEAFGEGIRRLVGWLKLTPEEIEQLGAQGFRQTFWLTQPQRRLSIRLLGRLAPAHWEQWMQTGKVKIAYASLSSADQALVRQFVDEHNREHERWDQEHGTPARHYIGDITQPGGEIVLEFFDGAPPGPDTEYHVSAAPADGHGGGGGVGLAYTTEDRRRLREEFAPPGFEREKQNPPPGGGPRVTVVWKPLPESTWKEQPERWEEVLKTIVGAADLQVVCDSYLYYWWEHNTLLPNASGLRSRPLAEVLDQVSEPFFYTWRRDGDVYLFRQRNWFLEKRHNVPERHLRRWRAHLVGRGRVELEDLAELAQLTDRQLSNVSNAGIPTSAARKNRELLRLYATLNPLQRQRLETTGLRLRELSARQLELLRAWKPTAPVDGDTRLGLRRQAEAVVFTLTSAGAPPQTESITLPRARPPSTD